MSNIATLARLHDIEGVQGRLRVGRSTVYKLIASGRLESVRLGDRRLVTEDALREFIESLPAANAGRADAEPVTTEPADAEPLIG